MRRAAHSKYKSFFRRSALFLIATDTATLPAGAADDPLVALGARKCVVDDRGRRVHVGRSLGVLGLGELAVLAREVADPARRREGRVEEPPGHLVRAKGRV